MPPCNRQTCAGSRSTRSCRSLKCWNVGDRSRTIELLFQNLSHFPFWSFSSRFSRGQKMTFASHSWNTEEWIKWLCCLFFRAGWPAGIPHKNVFCQSVYSDHSYWGCYLRRKYLQTQFSCWIERGTSFMRVITFQITGHFFFILLTEVKCLVANIRRIPGLICSRCKEAAAFLAGG